MLNLNQGLRSCIRHPHKNMPFVAPNGVNVSAPNIRSGAFQISPSSLNRLKVTMGN